MQSIQAKFFKTLVRRKEYLDSLEDANSYDKAESRALKRATDVLEEIREWETATGRHYDEALDPDLARLGLRLPVSTRQEHGQRVEDLREEIKSLGWDDALSMQIDLRAYTADEMMAQLSRASTDPHPPSEYVVAFKSLVAATGMPVVVADLVAPDNFFTEIVLFNLGRLEAEEKVAVLDKLNEAEDSDHLEALSKEVYQAHRPLRRFVNFMKVTILTPIQYEEADGES